MKRSLLARRVVAGAGVAAVVLAGVAGATAASADQVPNTSNPTEYTALTDFASGTGSLTLFKYEGTPAVGPNHDGMPVADTSGYTAIKGVKFTYQPIGCGATSTDVDPVDLTTTAGWTAIQGLKTTDANGTLSKCKLVGTATTTTDGTDDDGKITISGLAYTAYLVKEVAHGDIAVPIQPFIVTVPMRNDKGNWIKDITAYPKNKKADNTSTKVPGTPKNTVVLPDGTVTDNMVIPWTVTHTVASAPAKYIYLDDKLNLDVQSYVVGSAKVKIGTADGKVTAVTTECDTDTELTTGLASCAAATAATETVRFVVTKADGTLPAANDKIVITFDTKVNKNAYDTIASDGVKNDGASINVDGNQVTSGTGLKDGDGNTPTAKFTEVKVNKYVRSAKDTSVKTNPLAGAEFEVWIPDTASTTNIPGTNGVKGTKANAGTNVYVSQADGTLKSADNKTSFEIANGSSLYLVETKTVEGFTKLISNNSTYGAVKVDVAADGAVTVTGVAPDGTTVKNEGDNFTVAGEASATAAVADDPETTTDNEAKPAVVNVPNFRGALDPTMGLPITGAQGLMLLTIGGLVIVAAGVGVLVAVRRRQAAAE